jgi:hypothetical protein
VFYQIEGDDRSAFIRSIAGGEWSKDSLVIPPTYYFMHTPYAIYLSLMKLSSSLFVDKLPP